MSAYIRIYTRRLSAPSWPPPHDHQQAAWLTHCYLEQLSFDSYSIAIEWYCNCSTNPNTGLRLSLRPAYRVTIDTVHALQQQSYDCCCYSTKGKKHYSRWIVLRRAGQPLPVAARLVLNQRVPSCSFAVCGNLEGGVFYGSTSCSSDLLYVYIYMCNSVYIYEDSQRETQ